MDPEEARRRLSEHERDKYDRYMRQANLYQSGARRGTLLALANKIIRDAIHGKQPTAPKRRKRKQRS